MAQSFFKNEKQQKPDSKNPCQKHIIRLNAEVARMAEILKSRATLPTFQEYQQQKQMSGRALTLTKLQGGTPVTSNALEELCSDPKIVEDLAMGIYLDKIRTGSAICRHIEKLKIDIHYTRNEERGSLIGRKEEYEKCVQILERLKHGERIAPELFEHLSNFRPQIMEDPEMVDYLGKTDVDHTLISGAARAL